MTVVSFGYTKGRKMLLEMGADIQRAKAQRDAFALLPDYNPKAAAKRAEIEAAVADMDASLIEAMRIFIDASDKFLAICEGASKGELKNDQG
jgi:hypothetical protein